MSEYKLFKIGRITPSRNQVRPKLVAYYQLNYGVPEKAVGLKYFQLPDMASYPLDLNKGYEQNKVRLPDLYQTGLRTVLAWFLTLEGQRFLKKNQQKLTRVFTRTNTLERIINSHFSKNRNTTILVSRFKGDLYVYCVEDDETNEVKTVVNYYQSGLLKQLYSGGWIFTIHSFNILVTVDSPKVKPCANVLSDENISPALIHYAYLEKFQLIYSGPVQGIISNKELTHINVIEDLTGVQFVMAKQIWCRLHSFAKRMKFLIYWLDAYLTNIPTIYIAEKDPHGVVHNQIKGIPVKDIPKMFNFEESYVFGYISTFLHNVECVMKKENSLDTTYEFLFKGSDTLYRKCSDITDKAFIPTDYKEFMKSF